VAVPLVDVLVASVLLAATSLSSRFVAWLPSRSRTAWLPWLQTLAVGLLVGDSLLHVLPHAMEGPAGVHGALMAVAVGVACLVCVESVLRRASPQGDDGIAHFARMNLVGDVVHHVVDGIIVAAAFGAGEAAGYAALLAIALHEIPREVGSASVLVAAGYSPARAFGLSVLMACAVPAGALLMWAAVPSAHAASLIAAFAGGTILYVALADILPGTWARLRGAARLSPAVGVVGGIVFMWALALGEHHH
jgi:zinc and cadmium transporter